MDHKDYKVIRTNYAELKAKRDTLESDIDRMTKEKYQMSRQLIEWGNELKAHEDMLEELRG